MEKLRNDGREKGRWEQGRKWKNEEGRGVKVVGL